MARFFPLGLILFIFSSCLNEPDCIVTATNYVSISLVHLESDTAVLFDSILVSGTPSLYHEGDSVSSLEVPVDPNQLTSTFRFYYNSTMDSIRVSYSRKAQLISPACGAFTQFQDLSILSTSFGDLKVVDPQLSTSAEANLTIKL
jgi:hypothetical protein